MIFFRAVQLQWIVKWRQYKEKISFDHYIKLPFVEYIGKQVPKYLVWQYIKENILEYIL